jgi:transcriptional regulator with XRE-family HTH domain
MSAPLPHYLKTYRKRAGLSQDELAFLFGAASGTKVSRYEQGRRKPSLETALAYRAVFDVSAKELFRGHYQAVELRTLGRKQALIRRLQKRAAADPVVAYKVAWLKASLYGDPWRTQDHGEDA